MAFTKKGSGNNPVTDEAVICIAAANRLDGIGEYYFSQKLREIEELNKAGRDIINLGIGSPDLPPHADVIKVLQEESAKNNTHSYQSYKGSPVLRKAISEWYQQWYKVCLDPDTDILPLIGSKEGIVHVCMTYLNQGDKVLVPNPGYPAYSAAVKLAGGRVNEYELKESDSWYPDFSEIEKMDLTGLKLMFVNYPHMPTGQKADRSVFERLVRFARKYNILVVHDNPYSFILNSEPLSLLSIEGAKDHVVELNSLSKSHNMAGWRIGMLCGAAEKISQVLKFKSNMDSGMFLPVQLAAAKALSLKKDWHEGLNEIYKKRRDKVFLLLDKLKCVYSTGQEGLFVWARIPDSYTDGFLLSDDLLYKSNVFITPGGIFGSAGTKYVRVSLCTTEEKLEEAIERI